MQQATVDGDAVEKQEDAVESQVAPQSPLLVQHEHEQTLVDLEEPRSKKC
jgi:hypothetical protein